MVSGGIANTFMLAAGLSIGKSLAEPDQVDQARAVIELMKQRGADVPIPVDVVCAKSFGADAEATVKAAEDVADDDMILDIGPQTAAQLAEILKQAGTIVWNGPVGVFEFDQFAHGTEVVARAIAGSEGFSIAGGGDTLAAIAKYGIGEQVGYISTGGGAFLEFLEGKTCRPWPCWKPAPPEYLVDASGRNAGSALRRDRRFPCASRLSGGIGCPYR